MVRFATLALILLLPLVDVAAQSLGDVARKERKRREENERNGVEARVISDGEVRRAPAAAGAGTLSVPASLASDLPATSPGTPGPPAPDFTLPDRSGRSVSR